MVIITDQVNRTMGLCKNIMLLLTMLDDEGITFSHQT